MRFKNLRIFCIRKTKYLVSKKINGEIKLRRWPQYKDKNGKNKLKLKCKCKEKAINKNNNKISKIFSKHGKIKVN
jgi:hypothetical protein